MRQVKFVVSRPKFTRCFWTNAGGIVVDNVFFRLSISRSVLEIFAIKVRSSLKLRTLFIFGRSK